MADTDTGIVEALEAFSVDLPTGPCSVGYRDRFYASDPIVRGREHLFGPVSVRRSVPVPVSASTTETATAGPGERRSVSGRKGASGGVAAGKDITRA